MATIGVDPNGRKRVLFYGGDGRRRTIRLGDVSKRDAEGFKTWVETIIADQVIGRAHDVQTAKWIVDLDPRMRRRLAKLGLVREGGRRDVTLGVLLAEFFANATVKPGTLTTYTQTRKSLADHFREGVPLREIGNLEADRWRQKMKAAGLAEATISKRVKTARQIFKQAGRWGMVERNPFEGVKGGSQTNRSRMHFISRAVAQKVLDACPDAQWRLIFALSRFGGLRCPSEHLALRWRDIDWHRGTIRVRSPKTEGKEGGESRLMPMFPELRRYLEEVWNQTEEGGSEFVITRYREKNANLRTQLERIIDRAQEKPWPKLFHNLRSTRQTELAEVYPLHVVCAWLGNSKDIAQAHYLQVTDAHFAQAIKPADESGTILARNAPEQAGTDGNATGDKTQNPPDFPGDSNGFRSVESEPVTPMGSEQVADSPGKAATPAEGGTKSDTRPSPGADIAELAAVLASLDPAARARLLALARAAQPTRGGGRS